MTALAEIINESLLYIDDVRLQEQLATNPALFYRTMSSYVTAAMPMLSSPPELYCYVSKEYADPQFDSYEWVSTEESLTQVTVVQTGKVGYELCSVVAVSPDKTSVTAYEAAEYDSETGGVTFPIQSETGVSYEIDFYTDGSVMDLSHYKLRLFALAVAVVWDERFERTWLQLAQKVHDSSFTTVNEANYMRAGTDRLIKTRQAFEDELHKYEQINAYKNVKAPYPFQSLL